MPSIIERTRSRLLMAIVIFLILTIIMVIIGVVISNKIMYIASGVLGGLIVIGLGVAYGYTYSPTAVAGDMFVNRFAQPHRMPVANNHYNMGYSQRPASQMSDFSNLRNPYIVNTERLQVPSNEPVSRSLDTAGTLLQANKHLDNTDTLLAENKYLNDQNTYTPGFLNTASKRLSQKINDLSDQTIHDLQDAAGTYVRSNPYLNQAKDTIADIGYAGDDKRRVISLT